MKHEALRTLGGSLLVAGTAIGAGMLGLPVITGPAGFFPSILVLILCWAFMTATGLLFAELSLWLRNDSNILSMAKHTLGNSGRVITWVLYLFLFYCLTVAYLVGGASMVGEFYGASQPVSSNILFFGLTLMLLVALGRRVVDPINRLLMIGLFAAYAGFVVIGLPTVSIDKLRDSAWSETLVALPVTFAAFGFQGTVPTLASWMHYDRRRLRRAIIIGTSITLVIYILWQGLFLGIVPKEGEHGLIATLSEGRDAVYPLQYFTSSSWIWGLGRLFAFFALVTSFLGVGIGLVDFLADGLHRDKTKPQNLSLILVLAFGLPLVLSLLYPHVFIEALGLAGGFGCAILLGLLPILMVWKAKYRKGVPIGPDSALFTKPVFIGLIAFVSIEIIIECLNLIHKI